MKTYELKSKSEVLSIIRLTWLLICCTRVNNQSLIWLEDWLWLQLTSFRMALYSCKSLSYTLLMFTFQEEEAKLLYGMIFSLKSFVNKLSPTDLKEGFLSYKVGRRLWPCSCSSEISIFYLDYSVKVRSHPLERQIECMINNNADKALNTRKTKCENVHFGQSH